MAWCRNVLKIAGVGKAPTARIASPDGALNSGQNCEDWREREQPSSWPARGRCHRTTRRRGNVSTGQLDQSGGALGWDHAHSLEPPDDEWFKLDGNCSGNRNVDVGGLEGTCVPAYTSSQTLGFAFQSDSIRSRYFREHDLTEFERRRRPTNACVSSGHTSKVSGFELWKRGANATSPQHVYGLGRNSRTGFNHWWCC
jgi:hypothetical protein